MQLLNCVFVFYLFGIYLRTEAGGFGAEFFEAALVASAAVDL
jgi:hypothetical protein